MNTLDVILCVPLVWAAYRGFRKGLIIEVLSLVALAGGIYGAVTFTEVLSPILARNFGLETRFLPVITFALILLGVIAGVMLLGKALEELVNVLALKLVNKILGSLFSTLKVGLIIGALLLVVKAVDSHKTFLPKKTTKRSLLYDPLTNTLSKGLPALKRSGILKDGGDWKNGEPE